MSWTEHDTLSEGLYTVIDDWVDAHRGHLPEEARREIKNRICSEFYGAILERLNTLAGPSKALDKLLAQSLYGTLGGVKRPGPVLTVIDGGEE
jgi:hypothetical protein